MTVSLRYITAGTKISAPQFKPVVKGKIYHVCGNNGMIARQYQLLFIQSSFLILSGKDKEWKIVSDPILLRKIKAMNDTNQTVFAEQDNNNHLIIEFIREINLPKKIEILAINSLSLNSRREKLEREIEETENQLMSTLNSLTIKE